jgi:hypothetical protein
MRLLLRSPVVLQLESRRLAAVIALALGLFRAFLLSAIVWVAWCYPLTHLRFMGPWILRFAYVVDLPIIAVGRLLPLRYRPVDLWLPAGTPTWQMPVPSFWRHALVAVPAYLLFFGLLALGRRALARTKHQERNAETDKRQPVS